MIKELYRGNLCPSESMERSGEYQKRLEKLYSAKDELQKQLKGNEKDIIEKLMKMYLEILVIAQEEGYIAGFKDGTKMMIEITE